jgi:hypothetical protein
MELVHEPNCVVRGVRLRHHGPLRVVCKRPVPESCDDRAGFLWSGVSACYSRGTVPSAPEHNPRSGAWRKYGTSAIGHCASYSVETRDVIDIGISFEIATTGTNPLIAAVRCSGTLNCVALPWNLGRRKEAQRPEARSAHCRHPKAAASYFLWRCCSRRPAPKDDNRLVFPEFGHSPHLRSGPR